MAVKVQTITGGSNHANVQNLRGWSVRGTVVLRLRRATVGGQILASTTNASHELFPEPIDAQGGTFVEVVSGSLDDGVLYYV